MDFPEYNSTMRGNIKVVFGVTLVMLLMQVIFCAPAGQDEVKQDLTSLSKHQEDDIHARINKSVKLAKLGREHIMFADSCHAVTESYDKIVSYLEEDEVYSLAKTQNGICKKLCLLLKYTDPAISECDNYHESRLDTDYHKSSLDTEIAPEETGGDSDCDLAQEKDRAIETLVAIEDEYIDSLRDSQLVAEKAIDAIYNGLAVFKMADVELRGCQKSPKTHIEAEQIIDIARELRNQLECFSKV